MTSAIILAVSANTNDFYDNDIIVLAMLAGDFYNNAVYIQCTICGYAVT